MNSWQPAFDPVFPTGMLLGLLVLLFAGLAVAEWQRKMGRRMLRMSALFLLFLGVSGLFFKPAYFSSKIVGTDILLTSGYRKEHADSLLQVYPQAVLFQTSEADSFTGSVELTSLADLEGMNSEIRFVLGEGLPQYAFSFLSSPVEYLPGTQPKGLLSVDIPQNLKAGSPEQLNLVFDPRNGDRTIRLTSPEGPSDSVTLQEKRSDYSVAFTPKLPGRWTYKFEVLDSAGEVLQTYPLPVQVEKDRKLQMLFLQQFPSFETTYLKNHLARQGHAIAARYKLSQNKFRFESANGAPASFQRIDQTLLATTDLLFIDAEALAGLSGNEKLALEEAVSGGLGMLVWPGDISNTLRQNWLPFDFVEASSDTLTINLTGKEQLQLSSSGNYINPQPETYAIWLQNGSDLAAAYQYKGIGAVGTVMWTDSYKLVLKGRVGQYGLLWAEVIDGLAKKEQFCCSLVWESGMPHYPHEPLQFRLLANGEAAPELYFGGERVPLREDWQIDNLWYGTIWPGNTGWDSITVAGKPTYFFVHPQGEWASVEAAEKMSTTKLQAATLVNSETIESTPTTTPVAPVIFYLLVLFGAGGLWLAPKL